MFQSLEARRLLSLPVVGGVLTISGTDGNDRFEITQGAGGLLTLRNLSNNVTDVSAASVTSLVVNGGGGNDLIRLRKSDGSSAVQVRATLNGGSGDDTLIGGNNNDELRGNDGEDLMDGRSDGDIMNGGIGFDTADYSARGGDVVVSLDGDANDGAAGEGDNVIAEAILGGSGDDRFFGNSSSNFLEGAAGNDTLVGGGGNDTLNGGRGADSIFGEDGNDFVASREDTVDRVSGGAGTDSANVDAVVAGDPVDDLPTSGSAPSAPSAAVAASLAFAIASPAFAAAAAGAGLTLDPSFDGDGRVVTVLEQFGVQISDVAIQNVAGEEKIVLVGTAVVDRDGSFDNDFLIIRYNADGSLDDTFGTGGIVLSDFGTDGPSDDFASALVIDSAGRIIVVGSSVAFQLSDFIIARYTPGGVLDDSFNNDTLGGGGGHDRADLAGGSDDVANDVAIQQVGGEDMYVVAGSVEVDSTDADFALLRWAEDGTLDTGFGVVDDLGDGNDDIATALAIDSGGNIWVAGNTGTVGVEFSEFDIIFVGYDAGGEALASSAPLDLSDGGNDQAFGLVLDGAQALVVGSSSSSGIIAAFNIDSPDTPLGSVINATVTSIDGTHGFTDVALDADGGGIAIGNIDGDFLVYCFDTDTLDGEVGAITDFGDIDISFDQASGVAVQSDGKIVVAGLASFNPAIARYTVDDGGSRNPIAENILTEEEFQNFEFTYDITEIDENGNEVRSTGPLPLYLVYRIRPPVSPDGVANFEGTPDEDLIFAWQESGTLHVELNSVLYEFDATTITQLVIDGLAGNDQILADASVSIPLNLIGGLGHDILVGGSVNDVLSGGRGRDIVIGGLGSDRLLGDEDEDILIGGITNFDTDTEALTAVRAEWTSDHSYKVRIANISGGGAGEGLNGTYALKPGSSANKTVQPDNDVDELFGGDGTDWFLATTKGTTADILDATKGETVAKV